MYLNSSVVWITNQTFSEEDKVDEHEYYLLDTELQSTARRISHIHNQMRKSVRPFATNMQRMRWNLESALSAQKWANQCISEPSDPENRKAAGSFLCDTTGFHYTLSPPTYFSGFACGENMAISSVAVTWSRILQSWFEERKNFTYGIPKTGTEHYSQVCAKRTI